MAYLFLKLSELISNPTYMIIVCSVFVAYYYGCSIFFIIEVKRNSQASIWKKGKFLDHLTSALTVAVSLMLIWSLIELAAKNEISLQFLIIYYAFFILLYAFIYGILEWHFPGMIEGIIPDTWYAEVQYLIVSIQTQSTLGYTRAKPSHIVVELISCSQALLGLFFCIVFVAKAVNLL